MSITRLQQARQMYAMGQRVAKTLDGSRPGYAGPAGGASALGNYGGDSSGGKSANEMSGAGPSNDGSDNSPNTNIVDEVALTGFGTVPGVDYSAVGPNSKYQKNITLQNEFLNTPYKRVNIPPFIPGSTLINTAGNFLGNLGYKKNTQFFADNVAGKYGYGYGEDAYKDYMKKRMAGEVNAYGRPLTEGELRLRDGDGGQGIMDVVTEGTTDDTTDDTTTDDELILRFLGADSTLDPAAAGLASTDELRAMLLERARNLYT